MYYKIVHSSTVDKGVSHYGTIYLVEDVPKYLWHGSYLAYVTPCASESNKFDSSGKIIDEKSIIKYQITKIINIRQWSNWHDQAYCEAAVKLNGYALKYAKKQTPSMCLDAVKQYGFAILYVYKQTDDLWIAAISQNGFVIKLLSNQPTDWSLAAVRQNGLTLQHIRTQTDEICLAAISHDERAAIYMYPVFRQRVAVL